MKPREIADNMLERVITNSDSLIDLLKIDADMNRRKGLSYGGKKYYQRMASARAGYLIRKRINNFVDYFR